MIMKFSLPAAAAAATGERKEKKKKNEKEKKKIPQNQQVSWPLSFISSWLNLILVADSGLSSCLLLILTAIQSTSEHKLYNIKRASSFNPH